MAVNPGPSKLSTFAWSSIQRIFGISMHPVEHDRIRNQHISTYFDEADIIDTVHLQIFYWLGQLACQLNPTQTAGSSTLVQLL